MLTKSYLDFSFYGLLIARIDSLYHSFLQDPMEEFEWDHIRGFTDLSTCSSITQGHASVIQCDRRRGPRSLPRRQTDHLGRAICIATGVSPSGRQIRNSCFEPRAPRVKGPKVAMASLPELLHSAGRSLYLECSSRCGKK